MQPSLRIARLVGLAPLAVAACLGALSGCATDPPRRFDFAAKRMGTTFRVVLFAREREPATAAANEAFRRLDELNAIFSDYDPLSKVSRLCALSHERAPTEWRPITDELYRVLLESKWMCTDTGGAFDVTIGPFTQLWRRSKRLNELPAPERLVTARAAFGDRFLELDPKERQARLLARDMKIDLGGIAIGYSLDDLMRRFAARGFDQVLIDGGGDVIVSNPPPGEAGWRIAIDDRLAPGEGGALLLSNAAVTTSGDGFKFVEIEGRRYSHIVDPETGLGLTRRIASTVVAKTALDADALATSCCLLGAERALPLLARRHAEARIVEEVEKSDPRVVESPGFAALLID